MTRLCTINSCVMETRALDEGLIERRCGGTVAASTYERNIVRQGSDNSKA
jgi:hypothetical protein